MDLQQTSQLMKLLEEEFICPIQQRPIQNPVITPVGISYEQQALEQWLGINPIDPQSKNPLGKQSLIHNLTLKKLIAKIYKEVPKLERSLTEKDDIIANLTEEVAQLRTDLQSEKQKGIENEELMDFTLEKTKKIRKIQEGTLNRKQIERVKLKQKMKEMLRLKNEVHEVKTKEKIMNGEIADLKGVRIELNRSIQQLRKKLRDQQNEIQKARDSWVNLRKLQVGIAREARIKQLLIEKIHQYIYDTIPEMVKEFSENGCKLQEIDKKIDKGVDGLIDIHLKQRVDTVNSQSGRQYLIKMADQTRNRLKIQRYLMRQKMKSGLETRWKYSFQLINIDQHIGYRLQTIPYSIPPTQAESQIDWSQTIRLVCDSVSQSEWQALMHHAHKFQQLVSLEFRTCNIQRMTEAQLAKFPKLKSLKIHRWETLSQTTHNQLETYKQNYPQVTVEVYRQIVF